MNNYEITLVVDASHNDEAIQGVVGKFRDILTKNGAEIAHEVDWGRRKLAYAINTKSHGFYQFFYISAPGTLAIEFNRQCSYDESVLKYLVIGIEDKETAYTKFIKLKENPKQTLDLYLEASQEDR